MKNSEAWLNAGSPAWGHAMNRGLTRTKLVAIRQAFGETQLNDSRVKFAII